MIGVGAAIIIVLAPVNPQCEDINYARANPGQCQVFSPFPDMNPAPGGHAGGGLIGSILHHLGGLL